MPGAGARKSRSGRNELTEFFEKIGIQMSKLMNSSSSNVITPPQLKTDNKNKYLYCEIPYRGKTTQIFANKLKHLIQHQKPTKQLRIIQRPPKSIQQYFQIKDNILHPLKSNLVYHVVAKDGNDDYV
ncbi:unnamed protein product, partial [Didymodactylos carnosus]